MGDVAGTPKCADEYCLFQGTSICGARDVKTGPSSGHRFNPLSITPAAGVSACGSANVRAGAEE